jgi:hypothetical protein
LAKYDDLYIDRECDYEFSVYLDILLENVGNNRGNDKYVG